MLPLNPNILNMNAFFMTQLWERGRGKGGESKTTCAFREVALRDAEVLSQKKTVPFAYFVCLCDDVHVWIHIIKTPICGLCVGVQ